MAKERVKKYRHESLQFHMAEVTVKRINEIGEMRLYTYKIDLNDTKKASRRVARIAALFHLEMIHRVSVMYWKKHPEELEAYRKEHG